MKGKVLGFTPSAGSGAIAADNGERLTFVAAQWRSDKPIAVGTNVDFAPMAGVATEIYPVATAMPIAAADIAASPFVQKARMLFMSTLAFPLAALLLIACFMPVISSPIRSASLWSLGGVARIISANPLLAQDDVADVRDDLKQLDAMEAEVRRATGFGGMPVDIRPDLRSIAQQRAVAEKRLSSARFAAAMTNLLVVRWSVPILAAVLLWMTWGGKELRTLSLATGVAAIVTSAIIYEYREVLVGSGGAPQGSIGAMMSRQLDAAVSLGFGTYVIGLCGVALIVAGLGLIRNPLARDAT